MDNDSIAATLFVVGMFAPEDPSRKNSLYLPLSAVQSTFSILNPLNPLGHPAYPLKLPFVCPWLDQPTKFIEETKSL